MRSERRANSSGEVDGEEAIDGKQKASRRERERDADAGRLIAVVWQTVQLTHSRSHLLEGLAKIQCEPVRSAVFTSSNAAI